MYICNLRKFVYILTPFILVLTLASCPPPDVSVPNVLGLTLSEAEATLTDAGLDVGAVVSVITSEAPAGQIVAQVPAAEQTVLRETDIILIISSDEATE